jgi:hypothetical protein
MILAGVPANTSEFLDCPFIQDQLFDRLHIGTQFLTFDFGSCMDEILGDVLAHGPRPEVLVGKAGHTWSSTYRMWTESLV